MTFLVRESLASTSIVFSLSPRSKADLLPLGHSAVVLFGRLLLFLVVVLCETPRRRTRMVRCTGTTWRL